MTDNTKRCSHVTNPSWKPSGRCVSPHAAARAGISSQTWLKREQHQHKQAPTHARCPHVFLEILATFQQEPSSLGPLLLPSLGGFRACSHRNQQRGTSTGWHRDRKEPTDTGITELLLETLPWNELSSEAQPDTHHPSAHTTTTEVPVSRGIFFNERALSTPEGTRK